jgi:hypothetical protein
MSQDGAAARDSSNRLSPPLFELPENMNDYEVWTVRLPASLNVDSLQGVELDLSESATFQTEQQQQLSMTRGEAFENEQFRLLIRNDDFLVPHDRPFDRHFNISVHHGEVADTQLAPRLEMAPEPTDTFRQSYSHIPQVSGLKRRWMPPGGGIASNKQMKFTQENGNIEESVAAAQVKSDETPAVHSITASVASSTDTPPSSNRTPKEEPYMNGEHTASKKKAKKHKKDKKKKKEKKKRRNSKVKSEVG